MAANKPTIRNVPKGEYGAVYTGARGTCYICGTNLTNTKLIELTAHEIFILELYCKATNNTPPRGFTFFCQDRETCDKWLAERNNAMKTAPAQPVPTRYHPKPAVTMTARSRNKYG